MMSASIPKAAAFLIMVPRLSAFLISGQMRKVRGLLASSFRRLSKKLSIGVVGGMCPTERMPAWNL